MFETQQQFENIHTNETCDIIVADDHPILLHGVEKILATTKNVRIVATAQTVSDTFKVLEIYPCDILICDYSFYGDEFPDGLPMIKKIRQIYPDLKIIILSARDDLGTARNTLECGVYGFVRKNSDMRNVINAVHEVRSGNKFTDSATTQDMLKNLLSLGRNERSPAVGRVSYTPKEIETIRLLQRGLTLTEIAELTSRSVKTVSAHKQLLMKKLGTKSNIEFFHTLSNEQLMSSITSQ
ncbi:response regulator transcription factor [Glaciimonas sp. Gout2]|uniref:response regulator transcription factor n=2 Tax=Glaciimonas TaxID=1229970 RepID=UPI002AB5359B|nr:MULTISPECIES: response regulator transcription factor [unclassified Glaciimonas]MDY7548532.1 response regulator transcription factor [Glaciimonas sp. CA11.2]MEB0013719.1 response regulator transcription factor [Glaciimonas sp. Cout2]MEB0083324.1 response regulator transcription factor [Glaciimonas sp. Gout2]